MKQNNYYVITGGVGFGKTTLIEELCKNEKYYRSPEIAARLIEEQIIIGGNLIPWVNRYAFEKELLKRKIQTFISAPKDKICFFDRGIPDAIAFFKSEDKKIPKEFFEACKNYKYNSKIFLVPPWKEIYKNRSTRPQTYEESLKIGKLIVKAYEMFDYEIIEIPKGTIENRVRFIIENL